MNVDVKACARCGHDHDGVEFGEFRRPPTDLGEPPITHWAPCPVTGDPLLLGITLARGGKPEA